MIVLASKCTCMQVSQLSRSEMFSIIDQWQQSGLSQKAFCRDRSLRYSSFHYWFKIYRNHRGEQPAANEHTFVPLRLERVSSASPVMELVLVDGKRILFHHLPTTDFLKALL